MTAVLMADHLGGELDPRPVSRVTAHLVWLLVGDDEIGPFPKRNYRYYTLSFPQREEDHGAQRD